MSKKRNLAGIFALIVLVLLLTAYAGSVNAADQANPKSENIAENRKNSRFAEFANVLHKEIAAHWPHMDKIWPTYNYNDHNLILFLLTDEGETEEAVLINVKEQRKLEPSEYSKLVPPQDGGYDEIEFEGKPSLTMSVTQKTINKKKSADTTYRVATHEIVHFYYQGEALANGSEDGESRVQNFPLDKTPRLYRQMIYQRLINAYNTPEKETEYLGKAKYWLEKWQAEFPHEYKSAKSTDIAESIARYSENASTFVDADTDAEQIYKNASKDIKRKEIFYSADSESYEIGFVAGLILDKKMPDWKNNFYSTGSTAEELLLKDMKKVEDKTDSEIESKVTQAIENYNDETLRLIQNVIDAKKDKSVPYLKIDTTNSTSSMTASGMVSYEGEEITMEYGNEFKIGDKVIDINRTNILEQIDEEGNQYIYIPLQMPYEIKSDVLTIDSENLKVDGVKVHVSEENGRTIYFVKADEPDEVRLQDDFYEHVNGKLLKEKKGDADSQTWDQFGELYDSLNKNLEKIAGDILDKGEKYETGSAERTIADLYKTALDKKSREQAGLGMLKPYLDSVNAADSIPAYLEAIAGIRKDLGKSSLLVFESSPNPKNSSSYALFMDEPIQLTKKEQMESGESSQDIAAYIKALLEANGQQPKEAEDWSKKILKFYEEIATAALSQKDKNNVEGIMNFFTIEQLQAKLLNMNVSDFLEKSGQGDYTSRVVINPAMLSVINNYLTEENLELLKKYTTVSLLNDYSLYLNSEFVAAYMKFEQLEMNDQESAWEAVKTLGEMELGEVYAKKYFSKEKKTAAQNLVGDILKAYRKNIEQLDWLGEKSRLEAVKKIDTMVVKIGYPQEYQSTLKGIVKDSKNGVSLIDNAVASDKQKAVYEKDNATSPVDREKWSISPITLNAYYDPSLNEIVFPAAMLQAPFYDEKASYAVNLGGIGNVMAHEITHAFDDMGSLYDEKGNFRNWWSDKERQAFKEKAQKVVEYFGKYEALPGLKVDGELTLGENIADLGSLSVTSSMLEEDTDALKEMYKSYANIWATTINEEELKDQIQNDNHAPSKIRVNAVLSSTDAFYKAFDIQEGDGMYVPLEKRVKMY